MTWFCVCFYATEVANRWTKILFFFFVPATIIAGINAFYFTEHPSYESKNYHFLRVRRKVRLRVVSKSI
jgi:hypothetical protein